MVCPLIYIVIDYFTLNVYFIKLGILVYMYLLYKIYYIRLYFYFFMCNIIFYINKIVGVKKLKKNICL